MKAKRVTLGTVNAAWRERVEFDCNGTLTAEFNVWPGRGRLNEKESAMLAKDSAWAREHGAKFYVVYSYYTPIAWVTIHGNAESVYHVTQKFSVTTSKHQGRLY